MEEERLARLEEGLFFQERLLNELNAALTDQQRRMDALERRMEGMRLQVEELLLLLEEGGGVNIPPPHYSPSR
ncbi:MAG: SlyX family protein [Deltaproteobacteria bacterium]|jgi:SlyX protein|nr:SlyX family protein [Deltaproteobacteria bacterium]